VSCVAPIDIVAAGTASPIYSLLGLGIGGTTQARRTEITLVARELGLVMQPSSPAASLDESRFAKNAQFAVVATEWAIRLAQSGAVLSSSFT